MINKFRKFEDINLNEETLKETYQGSILSQNLTLADNIIKKNKLESKVVNDIALNSMINGTIELEKSFKNETITFMDSLRKKYNIEINNLKYLGDYNIVNNNILYEPNNLVSFNGDIYLCILRNKNQLPTNKDYWINLKLKGDDSFLSLGVNSKGYWDSSKTYKKFDMVSYRNKLFISKLNDNVNKEPETNLEYWYLAMKVEENHNISFSKEEPSNIKAKGVWLQII